MAIVIGDELPYSDFEAKLNKQAEEDRIRQECMAKAIRYNKMWQQAKKSETQQIEMKTKNLSANWGGLRVAPK